MTEAQALKMALAHIKKEKFLLLVDNRQPSLVTLITKEKLKGSWFSHPLGNTIYNTSNNIGDRRELLTMKLIDGKYTFIAPELRDAAYALTQGGADWQEKKLTSSARKLLAKLKKAGKLPITPENRKDGMLLEKLLLAAGHQEHTDSGKHIKILVTWEEVAKERGHKIKLMNREAGEQAWEKRVSDFNQKWNSEFRLPWKKK